MNDYKTFLEEETIKQEYSEFLRLAVERMMHHFKKNDLDVFYDVPYLCRYLMKIFNFNCIYGKYDIGLKDEVRKELFCRQLLDDFPWYRTPNIDTNKQVRKLYSDFFLNFCYTYRKYCLKRYKNYIKIVESQDIFDKIDSIQKL